MGNESKHASAQLKAEARSTKETTRALPTIGWREWVVFPHFENAIVKAKIDTGARTSALHAENIKISELGGKAYATFNICPVQNDDHYTVTCQAPIVDRRPIRNSGGTAEERLIVKTNVLLGTHTVPIELSLTSRDEMGFRMLLGRTAVRDQFLIEAGRSFVLGKP